MAEKPAAEQTEKPTPERLRKAREEGKVAQSSEVPSALVILMLLVVLALTASTLYGWFVTKIRQGCSFDAGGGDGSALTDVLNAGAADSLIAIVPFMLVAGVAAITGNLIASGWAFSPKAISPKFERVNPVAGLKAIFSLRSVARLLVSLAKVALILVIVWTYLQNRVDECLGLRWATPAGMLAGIARLIFGLVARIAVGLLAIAAADLIFQRWKHKRDLRMTKQEVKEEFRQHEASPETKGRIRAVQTEMSRKRMLQAVPTADVVVTNPTHVAVALKYEAKSMDAPQVVAKGGDFLCEKIKEVAREHNVPIVERPELARTLYATAEVGQGIPETLFVAVAEVLAMIYRLRNKRLRGMEKNQ